MLSALLYTFAHATHAQVALPSVSGRNATVVAVLIRLRLCKRVVCSARLYSPSAANIAALKPLSALACIEMVHAVFIMSSVDSSEMVAA
jgi:hypothetical protein